jgi:hypothetical protein
MRTRERLGRQAIGSALVFSLATAACVGPLQASQPASSEGKIPATFQSLDVPAARLTFRDSQTTEVRTLHVSDGKTLKRMAKLAEGQKLTLKYRLVAGATEPEIVGMSKPGDGWKRGAKVVVAVGTVFGLLVLGALLFGTE